MSGARTLLGRSIEARPRLTIFIIALALRWAYALILFAWMGEAGLTGADSGGFLIDARAYAADLLAGKLEGWDWLGRSLLRGPLFNWLIALCSLVAGRFDALAFVLVQGALDAGTCLAVFGIARRLDAGTAAAAGIAAAIIPTAIVLSGLVYTDTLFVFFFALSLLGAVAWLKAPSWRSALLTALALGAATLVRAAVVGWAAALLVLLLVIVLARRRAVPTSMAQLAAGTAIFALLLSPVLARNYVQYAALSLSPQGGTHWALWIVPLVKETKDGTPWATTSDAIAKRLEERYGAKLRDNPFTGSEIMTQFAREELAALGLAAIAKAWLYGAAINLASPAVTVSPPAAKMPRTGFFATPGATRFEKITNFLFHSDNAVFAWLLLAGGLGVAVWRIVELVGFVSLALRRETILATLLLFLAAGYFLAISGPIASPKYRLPLEPIFAVWAGAGWIAFARRRSRRSGLGQL